MENAISGCPSPSLWKALTHARAGRAAARAGAHRIWELRAVVAAALPSVAAAPGAEAAALPVVAPAAGVGAPSSGESLAAAEVVPPSAVAELVPRGGAASSEARRDAPVAGWVPDGAPRHSGAAGYCWACTLAAAYSDEAPLADSHLAGLWAFRSCRAGMLAECYSAWMRVPDWWELRWHSEAGTLAAPLAALDGRRARVAAGAVARPVARRCAVAQLVVKLRAARPGCATQAAAGAEHSPLVELLERPEAPFAQRRGLGGHSGYWGGFAELAAAGPESGPIPPAVVRMEQLGAVARVSRPRHGWLN